MIPLKDENPTTSPAIVNWVLIGICIAVYFVVQPGGQLTVFRHNQNSEVRQEADTRFTFERAAIPCEIVRDRPLTEDDLATQSCQSHPVSPPFFPNKNVYLAILWSMFLHGSVLHLLGNMLFLWVFGNNIEERFGRPFYFLFYLLSGFVATMAHVFAQTNSTIPVVGASGAIAGVMGAYFVLYPNAPINSLILFPPFVLFRKIQAKWLLGIWLVTQFFLSPGSGVAWVAHVGGFAFGAIIGLVWRSATRPGQPESPIRYGH